MIQIFIDAINYLASLGWVRILRVFWLFFLLDFPRYVLTDVYVLFYETIDRRRRRRNQEREIFLSRLNDDPPLVSAIIPILNEQDTIEWTVRSLKEQSYRNLQIIVVDDGSTDDTPRICRQLEREGLVSFFRFSERAGKSAALNYGMQAARGEYVVFVDSDTTFEREAIFNLMEAFSDQRVAGVSGNLRPRNGDKNILTNLQEIEYLFTISIGRLIRARFGILPVISGAFGGFRKEAISLESIGGQEPGPGNDSDLTIRVRKRGYRIAFAFDAICWTNVPEKFPGLIKQRWRWDRNLIKNRLRKHRDVFNPFMQNFRFTNVLSFFDSILFHVILACTSTYYLIDISIHYWQMILFILTVNFILYFLSELIEFLSVAFLTGKWEEARLILYLPLFNPYKRILKFFRIFGYIQELFFKFSYRDTFAPFKVRQRMIRW